ncbi:MED14-domain-containing protein [Stereum hirsutum FP-91666 SS1]|uniref:Mediator of RNA polymerase II transcription subunit 14 n=1 Tax=Stereum hirsutum (strain FP-91666) TaxID=721885 RepID=R7RYL6_STEHR|nr:MED14-domain-containing protein [Stereum hirsutum FP-91666 SS1]EIM79913.1 MED14-domain-containing protein [Stereum hirsutum FP-91666 SS1]
MSQSTPPSLPQDFLIDGLLPHTNGFDEHEPPIELLERELPMVWDGQFPLGDLVQRVVQACYAELSEMAETLPGMSDTARKRKIADFVVHWKKQIVKLYAVAKWSRDADIVQKCMNITAFLMTQNQQFEHAIEAIKNARNQLDPSRLRNHDLLTSLDVLTTGSYRRLPSAIKSFIIPPTPLTDAEVAKTMSDIEALIRYRLRMQELVPVEMSRYRIADGRVFFTVPKLFECSLSLQGGKKNDGWFFVHVEFLFNVGGDHTGMQEFPRIPSGILKQHLTNEADSQLGHYLPFSQDLQLPPGVELPPRPQLPEGVIDSPLIRVYNFLQIMSMSYQLEILCYQAERLRSLGWADFLRVVMSRDRKTLTITYWIRKPLPTGPNAPRIKPAKLPPHGGTLTISLVSSPAPRRSPRSRVLAEIQEKTKLKARLGRKPSDEVEGMMWEVTWKPEVTALGVDRIPREDAVLMEKEVVVDADDLDLESMLRKVIEKHSRGILKEIYSRLMRMVVFSAPGSVILTTQDNEMALRVHLCADELVIITIDIRIGELNLRDTGDLGAAGRGQRYAVITDKINENPTMLLDALVRLRMTTIVELAEQKANYLGMQTYRQRNFSREEFAKLGPTARSLLFIQLTPFPNHYLVLVVTDDDFRYALINVTIVPDSMYQSLVMEDIGWLDVARICQPPQVPVAGEGEGGKVSLDPKGQNVGPGAMVGDASLSRFRIETRVLRELYAYCCARVAHTKVEKQFKARGIPYAHVSSAQTNLSSLPSSLDHLHSALSHTIPSLCVQSSDILSGSPAFEAAMPNIRIIPLSWWSTTSSTQPSSFSSSSSSMSFYSGGTRSSGDPPPQVVTCVKLKYVQQPVGRRAGLGKGVIRPSKRIVYDANEAVVCFLADEVEGCVTEFLEEWAKVSKIVVIAREVAKMAKEKQWQDVRLLSFDLQTVEFAYALDYTVSITCTDQLSTSGGTYNLHFSRIPSTPSTATSDSQPPFSATTTSSPRGYNPHTDAQAFFRSLLRQGRLSTALPSLVSVLRDTVPVVEVLEGIRAEVEQWSAALDKDAMDVDSSPGKGKGKEKEKEKGLSDVDTFPKAAGWWRVDFRTNVEGGKQARHALDFRLMKGGRVGILDASHSLFLSTPSSSSTSTSSLSASTSASALSQANSHSHLHSDKDRESALLLQPIPKLKQLLVDAVKEVKAQEGTRIEGKVAVVDVGVVCGIEDVKEIGSRVWAGIVKELGAGKGVGSGITASAAVK